MTAAATFLAGARGRLLPASVPFGFFAAAVVFHVFVWAVLAVGAEEAVNFEGGPGLPLAALHLLTLGVLATTAMGAAFQLLPVATRQPLSAVWPTRAAFWLFVPGVAILAHGMAEGAGPTLWLGAAACVGGFGIFVLVMAANLRRARDLPVVAAHGWVAVISLAALLGLAAALVVDYSTGFLPDHAAWARAHLVLAVYGFMGMLVVGFSNILVPMFALSPAPPRRLGWTALGLAVAALVLAGAGALTASRPLMAAGVGVGLGAAGAHLSVMAGAMRARMRKRLGLSFVLIRAAWALLPAGIAMAGATLFDAAGPRGATLFAIVALVGWLLTFLMGILQRIMPFLAAMHAARGGGRAPLVSEMARAAPLKAHAACHFAALALLVAGIAAGTPALVRAGALVGLVGALAFAYFAAGVIRRMVCTSAPVPQGDTAVE